MAIIAKETGGSNIPAIEAGTHVARCIQIVHVGTVPDEYKGKKMTPNKVRIAWELPNELYEFDEAKGEEPRMISKEYTLSLSDKATLRKDLEAWRGTPFTEDELKGFDITKVIGQPCMLTVVNGTSQATGNTYAKVQSVGKIVKGMTCPDQVLETVVFMYDDKVDEIIEKFKALPEFVQDKIVTSDEWAALKIERPASDDSDAEGSVPQDEVAEAMADDDTSDDGDAAPVGEKPPF